MPTMATAKATQIMKVLLVDDSPLIRQRLSAMLLELEGLEVVGEVDSANEALEALRRLEPDVMIVDIRMPGRSGIGLLEDIKNLELTPTVIVLTNYPYVAYRRRCLELGAHYFFDKSTEFDRVLDVLRAMGTRK